MSQSRFWNLLAKKFSGEASADELIELENFLRSNPDWVYPAEYLHRVWESPDKEDNSHHAEEAFEEHLHKLKQIGIILPGFDEAVPVSWEKETKWYERRLFRYSASALVLLIISALLFWKKSGGDPLSENKKQTYSEVYTRPGSKSTKLVLPDSSIVWLNAGSKLTYNEQFGLTHRNTTLTGEAFFEVKKTGIPFYIQTGNIEIKVLGTAFNVKSYPGEKTETSLIRGSVEITINKRPGEKFLLKPHEKLVVAPEKEKESVKEPIVMLKALSPVQDEILETSWVENRLVFEDESFAELAAKMERWYGVTIQFRDEKISNQRLSGTFTTETIQEAMEGLQLTTPFHYSLKSNTITITK